MRSGNKYKQIMSHKTVHLIAFFLLLHVGACATLGSVSSLHLQNLPSLTSFLFEISEDGCSPTF